MLLALGIVLVTSTVLRLAWLGSIPAGLSHDETAKGYDAWSVLHTGRDQYGEWFPIVFRAIGDQREALLPYLIVLSEAVLGPTDLAVRLPTALAGIALIGVLFLLGRELFDTRAGLIAAALLAVSPWHVQVSRLAFRAGLLPLATALGLWLFLVALRRPRLMLPAGLVLGLG
ncbi:MAG: glycosyltransferase family 39 protein, partial [Dehalococcoidia bacterium]